MSQEYKFAVSLPEEFRNDIDTQKKVLTHSSRLIAWSWSSVLGDPTSENEPVLKETFAQLLKMQGLKTTAYQNCGDENQLQSILTLSDTIKGLLTAKNEDVRQAFAKFQAFAENQQARIGGVFGEEMWQIVMKIDAAIAKIQENNDPIKTLNDVLLALSGETLVFTEDSEYMQNLMDKSLFLVSFDIYPGEVLENESCEGENCIPFQYLTIFPYPARPALGEYTVTEEQLESWAKGPNADPPITDYLPPAYVANLSCS